MQEDPRTFDGGDANLHRPVGNDPTNATDPLGLAADPVTPIKGEDDFLKQANYAKRVGFATEKFDSNQDETFLGGKGENGKWTIRQQISSDDTAQDKAKHKFAIINVVGFEKSAALKLDKKYTNILYIQRYRAWEEDAKKPGTIVKFFFPKGFEASKLIASANGDAIDKVEKSSYIFYAYGEKGTPIPDLLKAADLTKQQNAFAMDNVDQYADQNGGKPWRLDFATAAVAFYVENPNQQNQKIHVKVISTISWGVQLRYEKEKLKVTSTAPIVKDDAPEEWMEAVKAWNKAADTQKNQPVELDK
jgi:hypothetical protein